MSRIRLPVLPCRPLEAKYPKGAQKDVDGEFGPPRLRHEHKQEPPPQLRPEAVCAVTFSSAGCPYQMILLFCANRVTFLTGAVLSL